MREFKFPDIGEGIHEGILLKWHVKVGDMVKAGDPLAEVETDKVNAELPSPYGGKVEEQLAPVGGTIHVGQVIIKIDDQSDSFEPKIEVVEEENAGVVGALEASSKVIPSSAEGRKNPSFENERTQKVLATPVARKMAHDLGLDIRGIKGTGPVGRIMKADIRRAAEESKNQAAPAVIEEPVQNFEAMQSRASNIERVPLSMMRKTIAKKMAQSKYTAPHATAMDEADVTDLVNFRNKIKEKFIGDYGISITFMPFIMKAVYLALKENEKLNSSYDEERQELLLKRFYHLGIAVDTEEGLMVPVIQDVDKKSIFELAKNLEDFSERARAKKLKLEELKGSTFSITNYGAVGSTFGVPVINYPEIAIIGIGKIEKKPVVREDKLVLRYMMPLSLSFDHRIVDGGDAGRFINALKKYLSDPYKLALL
ncbi:MAG: 2-oxo acid dehydrogenase subunit E2 [Geosporobacter ferrireducens]|nr:2-oxo acid dehydrogenase subunit E2 [Geosporobacter ferrireducens]